MIRSIGNLFLCASLLAGCASPRPAVVYPSDNHASLPVAPPPDSALTLDEQVRQVADQLAEQAAWPPQAKVAVLPLVSPNGGTTSLGFLLAEKIAQGLIERKRCQVLDRANLSAVMTEKDLAFTDMGDPANAAATAKVLSAEYLLTGTLVEAGSRIEASFKVLRGDSGAGVAMTGLQMPMTDDVRSMLVYVQRPRRGGGDLPPLSLSYHLISRQGSRDVLITDGSTVRSGETFRIRLQAGSDCYAYVLLLDSQGKASVLFPHPKIPCGNAIKGGVEYLVPPDSAPRDAQCYRFDNNPGTERFYLLASYEPIAGMEELLARLESAGAGAGTVLARTERTYTKGMAAAPDVALKGGFEVRQRGVTLGAGAANSDHDVARHDRTMRVVQGMTSVAQRVGVRHE